MQQLRYLVAIADALNFSRAAEIVGVTQPTLSMQIKELEARLGSPLLERTRARVMLTPVGSEIVRRARTILSEVEDIRTVARRQDPSAARSVLQMGVVHSVGAYVLSVAMPDLRRQFPNLRIHVREDRIDALPRQLSEGVCDVLVVPELPHRPEFVSSRLIREPLLVVLPRDHPLAAKKIIDPTDLAGETILTMERGHRLHDRIIDLCTRVGAVYAGNYEGTSLDTLRQMVAIGMGVSFLPALYVRSEVEREQLVVARPLSVDIPVRDISMVWRRSAPRQEHYELLGEVIRSSLLPWNAGPPL